MAALATASFCTTARIAACRSSLRNSATQRVRARWVVVQVRMASGGGGGSGGSGGNRAVLWFRGTDLRVHDNVVVHEAARRVQAGQVSEVLPLYCFDPRFFSASAWGNPKTGAFRAQFLLESVLDLKRQLRALGSDLVIAMGRPEEVLPGLVTERGSGSRTTVIAQSEVTSEETGVERKVKSAVAAAGGKLELWWGPTMYHLDDLPFREDLSDLPDVFTPFKQKCEDRCRVRACLPTPKRGALPLPGGLPADLLAFEPQRVEDLNAAVPAGHPQLATPQHDARGVLDFKGGESAALARLNYYLFESNLIATYFDSRNGMLGGDYSTKFAPWLAHGCLSPRTIYHEIKRYESQTGIANKSTYWVVFELIWRDFFRFFALKHGNKIFFEGGVTDQAQPWSHDAEAFKRWKEGRTGWPLVDANMRELAATGFMSNRGRQNVASFLALDLGLDWRWGADWFESLLLDYDVCSNWGNWVAAAGLTGGRVNKFNITKQSNDYDPQGDYIRTWVPELKGVPARRIHEPWLMSREEQAAAGVQIGADYPNPMKSSWKGYGGGGRPSSSGGYRQGGRSGGGGGSGWQGGRGGSGQGGRRYRSHLGLNDQQYHAFVREWKDSEEGRRLLEGLR
ncbi:hypothetical protein COHA_005375 [Chlorella ohadii]|uniref:Cryptochrome DASH n=1 Tax=Chlorella ohadii TaxID=2649997 RepID=A0AAD5DS40_9CHLO|nr:hypothetical protein COHA_005375 [Chlorella ohadii]